MTVSLAELLHCLSPSAGRSASAPWFVWVIGNGASLGLAGVLWPWRGAVPPERRWRRKQRPPGSPAGRGRRSAGYRARRAGGDRDVILAWAGSGQRKSLR
jgi:hypothetical protein